MTEEAQGATAGPFRFEVPTTIGNEKPLSEDAAVSVSRGLEAFARMKAENDQLRIEASTTTTRLAHAEARIEGLQNDLTRSESRISTAVLERDQAISERAVYEALFASFRAQLEAFEIPAAVLRSGKTPPNRKEGGPKPGPAELAKDIRP